ncbi:hypothetical protein NDR87_26245 [Nocardia sp. CDC159]|uniref:Uncharacterized protein n=1 Tax=Nocardia pulmonis TaxID=2951408 RepID=A0A9X2E895_9NOCA|nr:MULTISPECIES: hypothetical protein [Nocardia]MCM6774948.1 hypothetical protein [Nocardia pulmonis]MCM6789879.1 hypothetical protein [Nocardia sp. CDC159]
MTDRLEYGARWLTTDGEIGVARRAPTTDPTVAVELVDKLREIQRRDGRTRDAHLVARRLDADGLPVDDWQAVARPPGARADARAAMNARTGP